MESNRTFYFSGENVAVRLNSSFSKVITDYSQTFHKDDLEDESRFNEAFQYSIHNQPLKKIKETKEPHIPIDLGRQLFDKIQLEYTRQKSLRTTDAVVLFSFWKNIRNQFLQEMRDQENLKFIQDLRKQMNPEGNDRVITLETQNRLLGDQKCFRKQNKKISKALDELRKTFSFHPDDVNYTLKLHSEDAKQEKNMSNYFIERGKELKAKNALDSKPKIVSKEVQERLQKAKSTKEKREELNEREKKRQERLEKQVIVDFRTKDSKEKESDESTKFQQRRAFVESIISLHRRFHPQNLDFVYPESLYDFCINMWERQEKGIELLPKSEAKENIRKFCREKVLAVTKLYFWRNGYHCENGEDLANFWLTRLTVKNFIQEDEKKRNYVTFPSNKNGRDLLSMQFEEIKRELEDAAREREIQLKIKEEDRIRKLKRPKVKATSFEILKRPKDRLKVGKILLNLKKFFPGDKYLRKLIIQEFKDTRLIKHALEYDLFDSDEEEDVKQRKTVLSNSFRKMTSSRKECRPKLFSNTWNGL